MQDFQDVRGDAASGRDTAPLRFPEGSRVFSALCMVSWSFVAVQAWGIGLLMSAGVCALGGYVAWRNYVLRDEKEDAKTFAMFNVSPGGGARSDVLIFCRCGSLLYTCFR